jgi:hypothetical protein
MARQYPTITTASQRLVPVWVVLLAVAACSQEGVDGENGATAAPPGEQAQASTRAADPSPVINELPRACELLSDAWPADDAMPGDAGGSGPFRSVCRWRTTDGNRTLSLVVSSLATDAFDYRRMGDEALIAAITSLVAPSYADVRHVSSTEEPGEGAWSFEVSGDAVTWVNTGITHRAATWTGRNELFLLVRMSGGDDTAATHDHTLAVAADVQERLSDRSGDPRP